MADFEKTMNRVAAHLSDATNYFTKSQIIGIFLQGSQNYELDTDESDVDTKLLVTPTFNDLVFNKSPISTTHVRENNEHIDFKDFRLMFQTFRKQNINFIEVLFTKYFIVNPDYEDIWKKLVDNREKIAHYNRYNAVKAMYGMVQEKYFALTHDYPAKHEIILEHGYDGKQLSHMLRVEEFISRYINDFSYEMCLIPCNLFNKQYLIDLKRHVLTLDEAQKEADECLARVKELVTPITKDSIYNTSDPEVDKILNEAQYEILRRYMKKELS